MVDAGHATSACGQIASRSSTVLDKRMARMQKVSHALLVAHWKMEHARAEEQECLVAVLALKNAALEQDIVRMGRKMRWRGRVSKKCARPRAVRGHFDSLDSKRQRYDSTTTAVIAAIATALRQHYDSTATALDSYDSYRSRGSRQNMTTKLFHMIEYEVVEKSHSFG